MNLKSVSGIIYWLLVIILIFTNFNIKRWQSHAVIDWDVIGYYGYLPATFIHHDYKMNFLKENSNYAAEKKFWPVFAPNGAYVHKMSMGMSVLYSPFFFFAHLHSQIKNTNPNGFSWYYHKYIHLSCLFYLICGLFFLRKLLLYWFDEWPVALSLISVILATNLFYYATTEAAMSHAYSFSVVALFLYAVHNWFNRHKLKFALIAGICLGLLILIRPVNGLFALFPLLYGLTQIKDLNQNIRMFISKPREVLLAIFCCFLIILPQLLYWKSITGQYFFFSYVGEHFNFLKPMIHFGLFSFRNGWLIYTPVMILACIGMYFLYRQKAGLFLPVFSISLLYIYVVFSWWCWWYVGFGNRAMIDLYALLAIPLAAFNQHLFSWQSHKKWAMIGAVGLMCCLNLFQTLQYKRGLIHFDSMTLKSYLASFGRLEYTDDYKNALITPDYEKAKQK